METITVPTTDVVHDMSKVDAQLAELYRRAAGVEGAGTYVPYARTLLLNLVVFVPGSSEMAGIGTSVSEIMGTHPCRAIIVDLAGRTSGEASATISAVCGITERGDRRLCGEIIELYPEDPEEDLVGLVMPLLVPDTPVFVWVTGGVPCGGKIFEDILHVTDHVILDSHRFVDLHKELRELLHKCVDTGFDKSIQDLAWVSLLTWRDLAAQHFDPPQTRDYLSGIEKVSIRFARDGDGLLSGPLLFASWLIERTEIELTGVFKDSAGVWRLSGRQNDHEVAIELIPEEDGSVRGRLRSVSIQSRLGDQSASFYIKGVSGTEVSVTEECVGVCYPPLVLELPPEDEARLVQRALDNREPDRVFEAAVRIACGILEMDRT